MEKTDQKTEQPCTIPYVRCCDCKAPLDEMEQEENKKATENKEEYRCYYCFRQSALDSGDIGWL